MLLDALSSNKMQGPESMVAKEPQFFPVGLKKLAIMHVATFGLYQLHWFYENWWLVKGRTNARFNPARRAFGSPFYAFALFREIDRVAEAHRIPRSFSARGSAFIFLLGVLAAFLLAESLWPLALLLLYIPVHAAQDVANQINSLLSPEAPKNEGLSFGNKVAVVVGGVLFILAVRNSVRWFAERVGGV